MSLEKQIEQDTLAAMKSKDSVKTNTLRMLKAAITNYKIDKKTESLIIAIIRRYIHAGSEEEISFIRSEGDMEENIVSQKNMSLDNLEDMRI